MSGLKFYNILLIFLYVLYDFFKNCQSSLFLLLVSICFSFFICLIFLPFQQYVSLSFQRDFTDPALWWHRLPLLSGSGLSPRLQVKSILTHRPQGPNWTVTEFLLPPLGPSHKAENKWRRCQGWTEKSMPVYTDMTVLAPEQFCDSLF